VTVDDTKAGDHPPNLVFGKSIVRPPKPRSRVLEPVPPLPWRSFAFALLGVVGAGYAVARHYSARPATPSHAAERELPAPELIPLAE
jgi:hypothetical protein